MVQDQNPAAPSAVPARQRRARRYLILAAVVLVPILVFAGYVAMALRWSYSEGERAGYVQKFSRKGWVCKTWEGELAMANLPGSMPQIFTFTVHSDSIAHLIENNLGKQVSLTYDGNDPKEVTAVVISTQHSPSADQKRITAYVREDLGPRTLGDWWNNKLTLYVNPTGSFIHGGPSADAGVTGRKIIVDSYGGWGRHGGGAFSGKDPSKVDRSSAYFCRFVAKQVVASGFAKKAEIQVGYAIGMAKPVSVKVDTFGTGDERAAAEFVMNAFDFRPRAIIEKLNLLRPIYRQTTNYGHFGRTGLPWEAVEKAAAVTK